MNTYLNTYNKPPSFAEQNPFYGAHQGGQWSSRPSIVKKIVQLETIKMGHSPAPLSRSPSSLPSFPLPGLLIQVRKWPTHSSGRVLRLLPADQKLSLRMPRKSSQLWKCRWMSKAVENIWKHFPMFCWKNKYIFAVSLFQSTKRNCGCFEFGAIKFISTRNSEEK